MKKIVIGIALSVVLFGAGVCFAEPPIPNLVGTWTVQAEGIIMVKGNDSGAGSMHGGEDAVLDAGGKVKHLSRQSQVVVTAQKGRTLHGTFISDKAKEDFVMVIGWDRKTVYLADQDGFMDGIIVNKNRINFIYRHVGPADTVATAATWTRKK